MRISNIKKAGIISLVVIMLSLHMIRSGSNFSTRLVANAQSKEQGEKSVEILFTHDLHSYLSSYKSMTDTKIKNIGGMSRLSTLIKQKKAANPNLLVVDGGDFSMGTLYQTVFSTDALELSMLGRLGFDATTFGNHEFDYGSSALSEMFESAARNSQKLPEFVISNIDWTKDDEDTKSIAASAGKCNLKEYTVIKKGDVNIAIFGIFGKEAKKDAPTLKLTVKDQIKSAKETVEKIQKNENVDMIVCLSHSGTSSNSKKSEDEQLAKAVPEIDVILSAHSHTVLNEPIISGDTAIVSCGSYGENTGFIKLTQKDNKRWGIDKYELIKMDETIAEDQEITDILSSYNEKVDAEYLAQFNMKSTDVIAKTNFSFESIDDLYFSYSEHCLGNLISDSYRYAVNMTKEGKSRSVDISVVPSGTVRGTFYKGEITTADVFQCYSLGIGEDGVVGNPLLKFYLTGKDVKKIPEIDASISAIMPAANLYCSGISYTTGTKRMFLNKAYDMKLSSGLMEDATVSIDDNKLYCVVTDSYTAQMIGSIADLSYNLITFTIRYEDGREVEKDENGQYIYNNIVVYNDDGTQLKTWYAIASYLQSFDKDSTGVSVIPEYYNELHNRKVVNKKFSITNFFSQTNSYFWWIMGIAALLVALLVLIIIMIVKMSIKLVNKAKSKREK